MSKLQILLEFYELTKVLDHLIQQNISIRFRKHNFDIEIDYYYFSISYTDKDFKNLITQIEIDMTDSSKKDAILTVLRARYA